MIVRLLLIAAIVKCGAALALPAYRNCSVSVIGQDRQRGLLYVQQADRMIVLRGCTDVF